MRSKILKLEFPILTLQNCLKQHFIPPKEIINNYWLKSFFVLYTYIPFTGISESPLDERCCRPRRSALRVGLVLDGIRLHRQVPRAGFEARTSTSNLGLYQLNYLEPQNILRQSKVVRQNNIKLILNLLAYLNSISATT